MSEFLTLLIMDLIAVAGFLLPAIACGLAWVLLSTVSTRWLPNCSYSKWIREEVTQENYLNFNPKVGDCLRPNK